MLYVFTFFYVGNEIPKGLSVGARTNFWVAWRPFIAYPFDGKLRCILQKSFSPRKEDRFQSCTDVMEALGSLIDLSPELNLRAKIPTDPGLETEDSVRLDLLTNIGNG